MLRTITVASQKGGVGKTTTVVNLGSCLGLAGKRVLLLDLDPQANATSGVGLTREDAAATGRYLSALLQGQKLAPYIRETGMENVHILPSTPEVADLGTVQELLRSPPARLRKTLRKAARDHDYLLVDCPPSLGGSPTVALRLSDSVIIPIQCEYYAMEGLSQILPVVHEVQANDHPGLRVEGLLLTMFSAELDLSREVVDEISGYFGDTAFRTIVPRDVTLAEAASHGRPAIDYAPTSRGAWSYVELAREVIEHGEAQAR